MTGKTDTKVTHRKCFVNAYQFSVLRIVSMSPDIPHGLSVLG